jgi:hypothetical protein
MKAIIAILLLGVTGAALAETSKPADQPITVYKGGKPYIYDRASTPYRAGTPYISDRLFMRQRLPTGFRPDTQDASPDATQGTPDTTNRPAPVKAQHGVG